MPAVRFINAFGQTETASTTTTLGPADHIIEGTDADKEKKLKRLATSIGRPLADVEVKIIDEKGTALHADQVGEIFAKGPRIMKGCWGEADKSAQVITSDGWLRTGDKGWMDEDGYIYLAGRGDDMIIRGGGRIFPWRKWKMSCTPTPKSMRLRLSASRTRIGAKSPVPSWFSKKERTSAPMRLWRIADPGWPVLKGSSLSFSSIHCREIRWADGKGSEKKA
jgi:hypothetical protein